MKMRFTETGCEHEDWIQLAFVNVKTFVFHKSRDVS
jgi:hypothetical protein